MRVIEWQLIHAAKLRKKTLQVSGLVRQRANQCLIALIGDCGSLDSRHFEYDRRALAVDFWQQLFDQVSVQHLAVDVFPARMCCTHPDSLGRNQQNAVRNIQEAAALTNELCQACMASRHAMNFLVDFVNEFQFLLDSRKVFVIALNLVVQVQCFADHIDGRREHSVKHARIEPGRFPGIAGKHDCEQAEVVAFVTRHGQYEQCASGLECSAHVLCVLITGCKNIFGKVGDEVVGLVVVRAVARPGADAIRSIETKALGARHKRVQQAFRLAYVFPCFEAVHVC